MVSTAAPAPPAPLVAVVCEDDAVVATALIDTLNGLFGFDVVAAVDSGDEAVAAAARTKPDVVVVDLALAGEAGLGIVAAVVEASPQSAVVVLVPSPFGRLRASAEEAGAMALVELSDLRLLRRCLEQIHINAHAQSCPSCPAARPATTAAAGPARSQITTRPSPVLRPGTDPATGRPSSASSGPA